MVEIIGLSKKYGKKEVFRDLNLRIEEGSCYCLIGKNGAGKTTLLNCLLDLVQPDTGQVVIENLHYGAATLQIRARTGALVEDNPLIDELTGLQYLNLVGRFYNIAPAELLPRINSMAAYFFEEISELKKLVSGYSTGMKKKLGICAAVLHKPQVLVLDEPFTGLDPVAAQLLMQFIDWYRQQNRILIISSHDLGYVERVATHIGILQEGQLKFNGTLQEFTHDGSRLMDQTVFNWLEPSTSSLENLNWLK